MAAVDVDVLVIGGGPAGSGAAKLLAERGHRVLLIDRPASARRALAESIPPSAKKALSALGLANAVEAAGFHPWTGNTVWWGDALPRVEPFAAGQCGYQVPRDRFDAVLLEEAARAGVTVVHGFARDVDLDAGAALIDVDGETRRVSFRFVLDCSGRAGVIARKARREAEPSHRTVALAGVWRADTTWPASQRAHTLVASYDEGWAWSVPTDDQVRFITVMVDPERTRLNRGGPAIDVYRSELGKVRPFGSLIEHAALVDGPFGADASLYAAREYAGRNFLLVGDAGSFIDPLSSFGVKKALASAWLAGIVVNTALTTPVMAGEAIAFFDQRERAVHAGYAKQAAIFAREASSGANHPFWQARAASPAAPDIDDPVDPAALAQDPAVLAALAELQRRPSIDLRIGADVRIATRAAVRGQQIVMEEHLLLPVWPEGARYVRNIDLILLSRLACEHRDVGALYESLFRAQPGVSLPDYLGALATLVARGALTHAD